MNTSEINKKIESVVWANERFQKLNFGEFVKNMPLSDDVSQSELARRIGVTRQFLNSV